MSLKKLFTAIFTYIILGLTVIGAILIYIGFGARGKYNPTGEVNYYIIIGAVLILPMLIYILRTNKKSGINSGKNCPQQFIKHSPSLIPNLKV